MSARIFVLKRVKLLVFSLVALTGSAYQAVQMFASPAVAQEQIIEQTIDLNTAIEFYQLNQWVPALLGFQVLADAGDPVAQAYTGVMYREGLGIEKNLEEAKRWLTLGAKNGNTWAQHQLGWMYARAEITEFRDFQTAVKYWKAAAEGGHSSAQLDLAVMYWRGEGTPKDMVMAYTWLTLAGQDEELSGMVETNITGLRQQMSSEQIEAAEKLARGLTEEIEQKSSRPG